MNSQFWEPEWLESTHVGEERPKVYADITDDEVVEAVAFAAKRDREHVARGAGHVVGALSNPTPQQWPDGGPNGMYGLGLIPRFGEGSASASKLAPRLRRLVKEGRLESIEMVTPMGNPTSPAFRLKEKP